MRAITSSRLRVGEQLRDDRRAARRQLVDGADVEVGEQASSRACAGSASRSSSACAARARRCRRPSFASTSLPRSASRCCTPKRCCSSTIARPSRANRDLLLDHRVGADDERRPRPTRPARASASRALPLRLPVSQATVTPSGASQPTSLRRCCSARISVGAISAHCQPASIATRGGERRDDRLAGADVALQQPVHRHRRGRGRRRSRRRRGAAPRVSANGSVAQQRVVQAAADAARTPARAARSRSRLACSCESCCASSSSNLRRCQAGMRAVLERLRRRARAAAGAGGASASRRVGRPGGHECRRAAISSRSARASAGARPPCAAPPATAAPCSGRPASATLGSGVSGVTDLEARVHHLEAEEAAARLAARRARACRPRAPSACDG